MERATRFFGNIGALSGRKVPKNRSQRIPPSTAGPASVEPGATPFESSSSTEANADRTVSAS